MTKTLEKQDSKHLTFSLGGEQYGVEILKVREIIGLQEITAVPQTANHIRGVINLRGKIIPVLDLRRKFGLPDREASSENCIVTVMVKAVEGELLLGLLVDSVSEVVQARDEEIEAVPALGNDMRLEFVLGLLKKGGNVSILLDIDKVINGDTAEALADLSRKVRDDLNVHRPVAEKDGVKIDGKGDEK